MLNPSLSLRHPLAFAFWIALLPATAQAEGRFRLLSGTPVRLELQHHITSAYTPPGTTIWFRVAEDVMAGNAVAIAMGTPVTGRMLRTEDRALLGTSGSMDFRIDFVAAVDGQQIRVIASESREGRDRGNALAGWTIFWGLPGLLTRGVHGWLERGAQVEALVLHDRRIAPMEPVPAEAEPAPVAAALGRILGHRFSGSRADPFRLDFERDKPLGTVTFEIEPPPDLGLGLAELGALRLLAIDGVVIAEPVAARSASELGVTFDSWSILRYCRQGKNVLRFQGASASGELVGFEYLMSVDIKGSR